MDDYSVYQSETLRLTVTVEETGAETAELVAVSDTDSFTNEVNFDGLVADLSTNIAADQEPGEYSYYIRIEYDDGSTDILSSSDGCDGDDCEMPLITVCELEQAGS